MIYDCFTFNNELDVLEFRLKHLNDYVDYFVLSEFEYTHAGRHKDLIFKKNQSRFVDYLHKIIYVEINDPPRFQTSWTYENFQRNIISSSLEKCSDDDIIIISDVDEIPNLDAMPKKIKSGEVYRFLQILNVYDVNVVKCNHLIWEGGSVLVNYKTIRLNLLNEAAVRYGEESLPEDLNKGCTLTKVRLYRRTKYILNGGWHLSYLGGTGNVRHKFEATSHQELFQNGKPLISEIEKLLSTGRDVIDRKVKLKSIEGTRYSIPEEVFANRYLKVKLPKICRTQIEFMFFRELSWILFRSLVRKVLNV